MPPVKRKPKKKEEPKIVIPYICYCSKCENKGEEIKEFIYKCKAGVNEPYGNYSKVKCLKYKELKNEDK